MINLAVAEDNDLFRNSLLGFLKNMKNVTVLFGAINGQDYLNQQQKHKKLPDIVLMDYSMPVLDGRETTKLLSQNFPSIKVIIFSMFHHDYLINSIIHAGAKGFISKNIEVKTIEKAINTVYNNYYFIEMHPDKYEIFKFDSIPFRNKHFPKLHELTDKQKLFLKLCTSCLSYNEIAQEMDISIKTANNYRDLLCERFNLSNRLELVLFAVQNGITDILN